MKTEAINPKRIALVAQAADVAVRLQPRRTFSDVAETFAQRVAAILAWVSERAGDDEEARTAALAALQAFARTDAASSWTVRDLLDRAEDLHRLFKGEPIEPFVVVAQSTIEAGERIRNDVRRNAARLKMGLHGHAEEYVRSLPDKELFHLAGLLPEPRPAV
jgi:hypothetical protein